MRKKSLYSLVVLLSVLLSAFNSLASVNDSIFTEEGYSFESDGLRMYGSLFMPKNVKGKIPVVFIVPDGSAVNRDGNSTKIQTSMYRKIAYELALSGIASVRYDKRGVGRSLNPNLDSPTPLFEDLIADAKTGLKHLKEDKRFNKFVLIGHGEGALIAAEIANDADKFISIAGAGRKADDIIRDQINKQRPSFRDSCLEVLDKLSAGKTTGELPNNMAILFPPIMQNFMISWFRHDPLQAYARLKVPTLIIHGSKDLVVNPSDASYLALAMPKAKLLLIKDMNHIMYMIAGGAQENYGSYGNKRLKLSKELISNLKTFVLE